MQAQPQNLSQPTLPPRGKGGAVAQGAPGLERLSSTSASYAAARARLNQALALAGKGSVRQYGTDEQNGRIQVDEPKMAERGEAIDVV